MSQNQTTMNDQGSGVYPLSYTIPLASRRLSLVLRAQFDDGHEEHWTTASALTFGSTGLLPFSPEANPDGPNKRNFRSANAQLANWMREIRDQSLPVFDTLKTLFPDLSVFKVFTVEETHANREAYLARSAPPARTTSTRERVRQQPAAASVLEGMLSDDNIPTE